jgi:hypothetical protein
MIRAIGSGLRVGTRLVRLPAPALAFIVSALRHVPRFRGINPAMVNRQNVDLVFDDSMARTLLGYDPRPFRPQPADFQRPTAEHLRHIASRAQQGDSRANGVKI